MTPAQRTSKPAAQRRTEILDAAQHLFTAKGVHATSMEDILKEVGIAKGTLYYHFRSKEEILRAIIERITLRVVDRARAIADEDGPAIATFLAILATTRVEDPELELAERLHAPGNAEFHILTIVEMVRHLTPVLTEVVERGVRQGVFTTEYPRESVEILLTSAWTLLDDGIFIGEEDQSERRMTGIVYAAEVLLGCERGALTSILEARS